MKDSSTSQDSGRTAPVDWRRNLTTLFVVSILLGLGGAVYEVSLPLFLKRAGLTWMNMGWIYSIAAIVTFVVRIGLGAWSDRVGRKVIYVGSLIVTGAATLLTPFFPTIGMQTVLKSVTDPTSKVREAMHSVLLYECWPGKFKRVFSKTRGLELVFHFVGLLIVAWILTRLALRGVAAPHTAFLIAAAAMFIVSGFILGAWFREGPRHVPDRPAVTWRNFIRLHLTPPMWVLTISIFVFTASVTISHCFVLQLFFQEKYGASDADIFAIGAWHRLVPGLTLLFLGHWFHKHMRTWLMVFLISEGIFMAAPGFIPAGGGGLVVGSVVVPMLWVSVGIWLMHDFLGMGLWLPMQQELLQRYSRPDARGEDMSLSTALGALGGVPAPFIAGWLRQLETVPPELALNLPFIVSGIGTALSALILIALPRDSDG